MNLDDLKAQLDQLLAQRGNATDRERATALRQALVEFKVGIAQLRDALARSERDLAQAQRDLADYERRGTMAAEIGDAETARIATDFTGRSRERVDVLQRKVLAQRDELALAERDFESTRAEYNAARGAPMNSGGGATLGDASRGTQDDGSVDQRAREAAVEAQLAYLKQKLNEKT